MGNIERYQVEQGDGVPFVVLDTEWSGGMAWVIAECGDRANAEKIARALNNSKGAVEALRELDEAWADYSHKTLAGYPSGSSARERLSEIRERLFGGQ